MGLQLLLLLLLLVEVFLEIMKANFLYCFAENIDRGFVFYAEFSVVSRAIEIAYFKNWYHIWIESYSTIVVQSVRNSSLVSWSLSN